MKRQTLLLTAFSLAVIATSFGSEASAQNTFRRKMPLRWLGQGFSDGYHKCNPGYDSSHYNPYSAHNSFLYSQTAEYHQQTNAQNFLLTQSRSPQFFGGVPASVYAAPPRNTFSAGPLNIPAGTMESSFEPIENKSIDDEATEDGTSQSVIDENVFEIKDDSILKDEIEPADGSKGVDATESSVGEVEPDDSAFRLPELRGNGAIQARPASFKRIQPPRN